MLNQHQGSKSPQLYEEGLKREYDYNKYSRDAEFEDENNDEIESKK